MGTSRFARPDTTTLHISNGDTLTVKRRLNAEESRKLKYMAAMATMAEPGLVMAYLVDWSLVDDAGTRVPIEPSVTSSALAQALDALDEDAFDEIYTAVSAHVTAMKAEREAAKKKTTPGDVRTSALQFAVAGVSSGSDS